MLGMVIGPLVGNPSKGAFEPPTIGLMTVSYCMGNNGSLEKHKPTINLVVKHVPDSGGGIMTH